jgi:hypothetical protein
MELELVWMLVSFVLTLLVFSYLLGDNVLFRIVTYIFVGVSSGFVTVMLIQQIIWPHLLQPMIGGGSLVEIGLNLVPLILGALLFTKLSPRFSSLGNFSMAYLVGIGAAVIIGGAVFGTLLPQTVATIDLFDLNRAAANQISPIWQLLQGIVFVLGALTTLIYFQFSARSKLKQGPPQRPPLVEGIARFGQVFIAITLGALFAGVYGAAITALIERLDFLRETVLKLFG